MRSRLLITCNCCLQAAVCNFSAENQKLWILWRLWPLNIQFFHLVFHQVALILEKSSFSILSISVSHLLSQLSRIKLTLVINNTQLTMNCKSGFIPWSTEDNFLSSIHWCGLSNVFFILYRVKPGKLDDVDHLSRSGFGDTWLSERQKHYTQCLCLFWGHGRISTMDSACDAKCWLDNYPT